MAHVPTQDGRTSNRGFASMNQERQRQIASMGGKAVPDEKRSFSQNRRLAAEAGRKGGQSVPGSKRSFSQNRQLAAVAGRKGGQSVPDEKRSFSQSWPPRPAARADRPATGVEAPTARPRWPRPELPSKPRNRKAVCHPR